MKALMKGDALAYFAKKQRAQESIEQVMNQIQAKVIAKNIGIDQYQIKQTFSGFFEQIQKIKLPKGFKRCLSNDRKKVIYSNQQTGEELDVHPNIQNFKVAFYEMVNNNKAVYTLSVKQRRLLPFVEDKLIRQCIGLASKRRDAQKANLQRDQDGKVVLSKLARLKPDMRGLISSRSYMLKTLVEKIYTKKQFWGKGKRASAYAQILNKRASTPENYDDDEVQTEQSLQKYENIYEQSKKFYISQYGNLNYIPQQLMKEKAFLKSTPQSVFRNIYFLNIQKDALQLYWLARLMQCLPLPLNWTRRNGDSFDEYRYEPEKIVFDLHPSYLYILENMNRFKTQYENMNSAQQNYYANMRQMVFFDYFERPYFTDLYSYISMANQGNLTRKKVFKKSNQLRNNDWMALQAIKNSGMKQSEYPGLQNLMNYWGQLNYQQQTYLPAISPFGQVIWSNSLNQKTIQYCPHFEKLTELNQVYAKQMPTINTSKDYKKYEYDIEDLKIIEHKVLFQVLPAQREKFLQYYIKNDPKPLSQPYNCPQDIKKQLYYDSTFVSQFDVLGVEDFPFECEEDGKKIMPLWLQKCIALQKKQKAITILSKYPQYLKDMKQLIKRSSLEQISQHEPGREEQIENLFRNQIKNTQQLKKFIIYLYDLDARQQRKRLARIGMNVQKDQDLLGSSISQIDVNDLVEDDQDQQQQDQQQQESQQQSSRRQPDINDITSDQQQVKQQQVQIVEQQEKQEIKIQEKYQGIIYQKSLQFDRYDNQMLDKKLKEMQKQKTLKHKFSQRSIREKITSIELSNPQYSTDIKKNLLVSQFSSHHAPYKVSPSKIIVKKKQNGQYEGKRNVWTSNNVRDVSQDYPVFKSQASDYSKFNDQMHDYIEEWKEMHPPPSQESSYIEPEEKKRVVDDTRETIQLQPIYRIKPDINKDPKLCHISQAHMVSHQYRKLFNQKSPIKNLSKKKMEADTGIDSDFDQRKYNKPIFNPQSFHRQFTVTRKLGITDRDNNQKGSKIIDSKMKLSEGNNMKSSYQNNSIMRSQSVNSINSKLSVMNEESSIFGYNAKNMFKRVCLGSTASSLLASQVITKKGDLLVLEAQKQLMHKGRGLQTILSRQY